MSLSTERRLRAAAAALCGGRVALKEPAAAQGSAARHSVRVLRAAPCMLALSLTDGLLFGAWHWGLRGLDRLSGA